MSDLARAKELLQRENLTLALVHGEEQYTSDLRGILPLLQLAEGKQSFVGWSAADKIVGKAAAILYVCLSVKEVYAEVMSRAALAVFSGCGISVEYGTLVEKIINRRGDGICPMEATVEHLTSAQEAPAALRTTLNRMMKK